MKKGKGKKGDVSIGFVISVLLGVAVLVFGIFLISSNTGREWIGNLFGGEKTNYAAISFGCQQKCNSGDMRGYCVDINNVIFEKGGKKEAYTCKQLEMVPNSGLEPCDKLDCNIQLVGCTGLAYVCSGTAKCAIAWMDKATFDATKNDKTKYKEVSDFTVRVTDIVDKNSAITAGTPYCVKTVEI